MRRKLHTTWPRLLIALACAFVLLAAGVFAVLIGFSYGRRTEVSAPMIVVSFGIAVLLMIGVVPVWFMGHVRAVHRRVMPVMFGILLAAITFSSFAATGRGWPDNMTTFEPWGVNGIAFAVGTMALFGVIAGAVVWAIAYPRAINEDRLKRQAGMFD